MPRTRLTPLLVLTLSSVVGWGLGCQDPSGDENGDETSGGDGLSHAADIQPIWDDNCVSFCHEPGGLHEALDLRDGYAAMVNVASAQASSDLVDPGAAASSYLVAKLRGTQIEFGGQGGQMPGGGAAPLGAAELDLIEAWIDAGAPP